MYEQITILGPGLLGASLAMAVKNCGLAKRVVTWSRRAETRAKCIGLDWCDAAESTAEEAVRGSQLVILCTPVDTIAQLVEQIRSSLDPETLVTDVGSTKSLICRNAQNILADHTAEFIGSHPMAGSERAGMEHARADLFEKAACLITPLTNSAHTKIAELTRFWKTLGMFVDEVSPERHDEIVAHISHLPHFLAATLCSYLAGQENSWQNFAGGGLRDTTRIASGEPGLWQQIFSQNREELVRALDGFENELQTLKAALLNGDTFGTIATLERGKKYRDRLRPKNP